MVDNMANKVADNMADNTANKVDKQAPVQPYISVDTFLKIVQPTYKLTNLQVKGFKVKMKSLGKSLMPKIDSFILYLNDYIGKK